jgi:hypothetical protein
VEHSIRTNAIDSPHAHFAQNKNGAILHQYAAKATQRIKQLKLAINPAVTIAVALSKAQNEQDRRIRASGGKKPGLRNQWLAAMGKIKRTNLGAEIAKYDLKSSAHSPQMAVMPTYGGTSQYHDPIPLFDTAGHRPGAISSEPGFGRPGLAPNQQMLQLQAQLVRLGRHLFLLLFGDWAHPHVFVFGMLAVLAASSDAPSTMEARGFLRKWHPYCTNCY